MRRQSTPALRWLRTASHASVAAIHRASSLGTVSDGVDAGVQPMESPLRDGTVDPTTVDACVEELMPATTPYWRLARAPIR